MAGVLALDEPQVQRQAGTLRELPEKARYEIGGQAGDVLAREVHVRAEERPVRGLERDEGEREPPYSRYPWDGVSGVRPYRALAATTTVGVY